MFYSKVQEIELAQKGDMELFEKIVKDNNGLIWSIVRKFTGKGYEMDDLYQIGCVGFVKAVKRFEINYNYQLSTFAVPYILGEIKKYIRDDGIIKISRNLKELGIKIREIENECLKENKDMPSIKELAKKLNVKEEDVVNAIESRKQVESINECVYENGSINKIEQIVPKEDEQAKLIDNLVINEIVESLDKRDKQIIKLRFFKEKTQSQVAKILGISQVQVSRLEKRILNDMKSELVFS